MKKSLVFSVAVLLLAVSCNEVKPDDAGETSSNELTVVIDRENGANGKATLDDTSGAFAWSRGDQIKVYDGTGIYTGTTQSTENYGLFSVEKPFNINNGSGWVVFPANIVTGITASSISITLPTSYTFSQVGSDDPDDSKAPVPMFGAYTANNKVTLKQLGAVVRIKLTNIAAGTVSFAFPTNVTGTTTIDDPSVEDPISSITADFSGAGKVITISNVPETTVGNYIFITLPVPTGTAPENIYVTNEPANGRKKRIKTIVGSSTPLTRAQGYKLASSPETIYITPHFQINAEGDCVVLAGGNLMAQINELTYPTATVSAWKFGGAF